MAISTVNPRIGGSMPWRISLLDPLQIDSVLPRGISGRIGMTLCPGMRPIGFWRKGWERDLYSDLDAIRRWSATAVVTLIEEHEMQGLGIPDLPQRLRENFAWHWLPIEDGGVPDSEFEIKWRASGAEIRKRLALSESVLIHCAAGLGRTGTVAARLLVEFGASPREAIAAIRGARRGAIQTLAQERYVLRLARSDSILGTVEGTEKSRLESAGSMRASERR